MSSRKSRNGPLANRAAIMFENKIIVFILLFAISYLPLVTAQPPASSPPQYPICYVCGGNPKAKVTYPDITIDIPPGYNAPVPQATCSQIEIFGLNGLISEEACAAAIANIDGQIECGCSIVEDPSSVPVHIPVPVFVPIPIDVPIGVPVNVPLEIPIDALPSVIASGPTQFPICYVCGGDPKAKVTYPDVTIDLPPGYNAPVPQATCSQIETFGLNGLISEEACAAATANIDAQIDCGCSVVEGPSSAPTTFPLSASFPTLVELPENVPIDAPVNVLSSYVPTPTDALPFETSAPAPVNEKVKSPSECQRMGKMSLTMSKRFEKGRCEDSSDHGKGSIMMRRKHKRPREPKTPTRGMENSAKRRKSQF